MNAMEIEFPDNTFAIVYAANLLHHLARPKDGVARMHRVLKQGSKACFWHSLRHNPVTNVYQPMALEVRTEDEMPLTIEITDFVRSLFPDTIYDTFWLTMLWIFLRFYPIGVDPDKERYWKKIIAECARLEPPYRRLERLDRVLEQTPFIRKFAWNSAVVATK